MHQAKDIGIPIYTADIIYHLFDAFTKRVADVRAKKKEEARKKALWPCVFKIVDERSPLAPPPPSSHRASCTWPLLHAHARMHTHTLSLSLSQA